MTTLNKIFANDIVTYVGDNRDELRNRDAIVLSVGLHNDNSSQDLITVKMQDSGEIVYGARWAWQRQLRPSLDPDPVAISQSKSFDIDELFTDAAGGKVVVAQNEIKRLKARIVELEKFVEVYNSL